MAQLAIFIKDPRLSETPATRVPMNLDNKCPYISVIMLVSLLFFAVPFSHSSTGPKTVNLSLKMAMAMAIRNNLDLRVDALDSSIAETAIQGNRGIYDPFLSVSASTGETFYIGETYGTSEITGSTSLTQNLPTGGSISATTYVDYTQPDDGSPEEDWTDWYTSVGLTLTQPILKNAGKEATELNISLAGINYEDSLEQFRDSVIDTIYSVIKSYNRLYTLRQNLESREKAISSARQLRDKIKEQETPDERQDVELANAEYAINDRLKDLVSVETRIKDEEADLRFLIGEEDKLTIIPVDPPSREEPLETTQQAIMLALEKRSDLKQLRLDLEASELQERVKKRNLLPDLDLTASGGFRGVEDTFKQSTNQIKDGKGSWWSAGVQISIPFGNSVAESDYRRNKLRTQQVKNRIAAAEWDARDEIEEDMRALLSARIQRQVADKAVALALQRVETYRKSLADKRSNVQDLLNAESDLVYALNNQTAALESFANGVALLWKDSGILLERKNINLDFSQPEKLTAETQDILAPEANVLPEALTSIPVMTTVPSSDKVPSQPAVKSSDSPNMETTAQKTQPGDFKIIPAPKVADKPSVPSRQNLEDIKDSDSGYYTLKIGEYASSELGSIKEKVKIAGLEPTVAPGPKLPRQVIRLYAGSYKNTQLAQTAQRMLDNSRASAFLLKDGNSGYRLYAGSFFTMGRAHLEQERLARLRIEVTLEESTVLLPTSVLTAGKFSSREAAYAELLKLEMLGIDSVVQSLK